MCIPEEDYSTGEPQYDTVDTSSAHTAVRSGGVKSLWKVVAVLGIVVLRSTCSSQIIHLLCQCYLHNKHKLSF